MAEPDPADERRTRPYGDVLRLPINHFEGNYTCPPAVLDELRAEDRIILRYLANPNGSTDAIAGICSAARNVVGLMPHPERAYDLLLGSEDGRNLLASLVVSGGSAPSADTALTSPTRRLA